jgi:hemerythrin-like domain-containing protein
MVIDILRQEHRNIETLLLVLERELGVFARGERPDYEVVHAVIAYFQVYPDERIHMAMEERYFFPAAVKGLQPQDWAEIAARLSDQRDPLFSDVVEEKFEVVRSHILQLEQEAEAERSARCYRN